MLVGVSSLVLVLWACACVQGDITNVNEFLDLLKKNPSTTYPVAFLSEANANAARRYLLGNTNITYLAHKEDILKAVDDETITAGITTGLTAEDVGPKFHVFSSLIVSPQAMLLAPDYNAVSAPYGLKNASSQDLFDALNAAIADVQRTDKDENLLTENHRTDLVRAYSCRQDTQLPVPNRNATTGYLRDILFNTKTLRIGGLGPSNWGPHDGDYTSNTTVGFYPRLLEAIVETLGKLKGPDGFVYGEGLKINRTFYPTEKLLFQALLDGGIHATDVYLLVDAPYQGTGETCSNDTQCRARESCEKGTCSHSPRSRSIHFRTTCTTASRTTKFITKKNSRRFPNDIGLDNTTGARTNTTATTHQTPKTRWIGFLLLFSVLFGSIFLTLLVFVRRKKNYRIEQTLPGGIGKFARLQEEAEPPMEGMDSFDDHIVQSPRDTTHSTS